MTKVQAIRIYDAGKPHHTNAAAYRRWRRAAIYLGKPTHHWKMSLAARMYYRAYKQEKRGEK